MAQLTLDKLQAVVGLAIAEAIDTDGSFVFRPIGTGFIYAHSDRSGWLVTCKHVVQEIVENSGRIIVRSNKEDHGEMMMFRANLEWTFHPSADVAVHVTDPEILKQNNIQYMALHRGYTRGEAMAASLLEGDSVFIIGFPSGWREGRQDYPVVRYGVLAQVRGWYNEEHETFLVDGSGFGGNSGGPVVTKPEISAVAGWSDARITESRLIGMVSKVTREPVEVSRMRVLDTAAQTGETKPVFLQHSDLIEVVPVDLIEETIELAKTERAASTPVEP
ncbi:MAG: trypsin-like serine protease [Acidimicrobiaceae bacterium]|nr:trypsin-like serine protease [Acidimicrobiaceae bacterium]MYF42352.1 trypsin-like serine protease [Acidimicrobiaceae bacterium]